MEENNQTYLYELKDSLITPIERKYLSAVEKILPSEYYIQPQVNLASIIERKDNSRYQNELYRNIDACIFDKKNCRPIVLIEINDESHNRPDRIERDKKVKRICEEAGIPLVVFWVKFGVNIDYIQKRILEAIEQSKNPVRIAHSAEDKGLNKSQSTEIIKNKASDEKQSTENTDNKVSDKNQSIESTEKKEPNKKQNSGCYIATCVYGSYDCPEVWTLRRFRDQKLSSTYFGRTFIHIYYFISPKLVRMFGNNKIFKTFWKHYLDRMVNNLQKKGFENTPYMDYNK